MHLVMQLFSGEQPLSKKSEILRVKYFLKAHVLQMLHAGSTFPYLQGTLYLGMLYHLLLNT